MILHCMLKSDWEKVEHEKYWGQKNIEADGFIHCSPVRYFWRVAGNFDAVKEDMVLLMIDEDILKSEVRYEDGDNVGRAYPHVYGLINNDAVKQVLPFLRNSDGRWKKNPELMSIQDE